MPQLTEDALLTAYVGFKTRRDSENRPLAGPKAYELVVSPDLELVARRITQPSLPIPGVPIMGPGPSAVFATTTVTIDPDLEGESWELRAADGTPAQT